MALEQTDLRQLNVGPQFRSQQQQVWVPQNPPSPRKVKLLCSFGGKILPRPSDGALRYVGGHTRIISVPKDIAFPDLMAKMAEVNPGPGPTTIKYQLPTEDLDALISVSCPEDLDNMMDEYDKIAADSSEGSNPKIRVFLFSPEGAASSDLGAGDLSDTGQRYFEAVNGIGTDSAGSSSVGSLMRKDSGMSAGSSNSGIDEGYFSNSPQNLVQDNTLVVQDFTGQGYSDPNVNNANANANAHGVNLVPLPVNVSSGAAAPQVVQLSSRVAQPLSQFPPLPSPMVAGNAEGYGLNMSPVANQEVGMRADDCHMCQKMLPHAHSDPIVQNIGGGSPGARNMPSPVFYSQQPHANLGDNNVGEVKVVGQPAAGAYGYPQYVPKMENVDNARVFLPPGSVVSSPDSQSSFGLFLGNFPRSPESPQDAHPVQQQQQQQQQYYQQQWAQNVVPSHCSVMPEVIARPVGNEAGLGRNNGDGSPQFANEYARPLNGMMEGLHLNPSAASGFNGHGNAVVMQERAPLVVDGAYVYMPQVGGNVMMPSHMPFGNAGVAHDRNYVRVANEQLPPTAADVNRMHNFQAADAGQVYAMAGNQGPFPHHLGVREHPNPSENFIPMPAYTSGIDPTYSDRVVNNIPVVDLRSESSQLQYGHLAASQGGNAPFVETFQEPVPTDSLFCNPDPRTIVGGGHPLPPRPRRVTSRESIAPKDSSVQHLGNSTESEIIALLEEGGVHPSPDSLNKDSLLDPTQPVKGSGDEQIKKDLQAVAEGVASSVLTPSPSPVFFDLDAKEISREFQDEKKLIVGNAETPLSDRKMEDNKPMTGLHSTDDIGRLQIIKNSDLEELRELGSGTFGTVFHGKWRGSDVAIKRINDRCFAGKPSEQERMRADFWNEACKLADLHHPNVVAFYGVVLDGPGGSVATVTEYMVNGSLRTALQRHDKSLDRRKRLLIAMDVAFGMEYLHGKNIVHFDLKSDNLLVNLRDPQRPICKVGDLGLSKVKCRTLISGGVRGTLPWMAPELLNGSSSLVSEKVDVFSFGIVMWELLTGEEPYADLHYGAIIGGIVSNTLRPPVPENCDPEWRALMERCWSADPSERPSFTEVAERLRTIASALLQKGQAHPQVQK